MDEEKRQRLEWLYKMRLGLEAQLAPVEGEIQELEEALFEPWENPYGLWKYNRHHD